MKPGNYITDLTLREGKKKSMSRAQVSELVGLVADDLAGVRGVEIYSMLNGLGVRRAKKKPAKKSRRRKKATNKGKS